MVGQLTEAMHSAQGIAELDRYEAAVKEAVRDALVTLDPTVSIEDTHYFNHSAVPDFMLSWGKSTTRPLFVRRSFEEIAYGHDVDRLSSVRPVILSAQDGPRESDRAPYLHERIAETAGEGPGTLIASSGALDQLMPNEGKPTSPLAGLLNSQVLPVAKGVLDEARTHSLTDPSRESIGDLGQIFPEYALVALSGVLDLTALALGDRDLPTDVATDELSAQEAAQLVPWLLATPAVRDDVAFWAHLASRVSLDTLEKIHDSLKDLDLSRLAKSGVGHWRAKRGYATTPAPWALREDGSVEPGWFMRDGNLTHQTEAGAYWFRNAGKGLQGRNSLSTATWESMEPRLEGYQLLEVALKGVDRSINLNANRSPDVASDAALVVASLEDNYFVDEMVVRTGIADELRAMRVEISRGLVFNEADASVADMEEAMRRFVNYRSPLGAASGPDSESYGGR